MFKGKLILITAFVMFFSILNASEKRAITFEDFFSMKRLGSVALSPDKSTIAYTLKIPNTEQNNFKTDIWLLDLKTKKSLQFTNNKKSSSGPVWSTDSKALYFNRDGQIWKKDIKEDSAKQVTHFAPYIRGLSRLRG
jgi:dipeptidyl aminopeptidase/acylaminoacyl peptidase